MNYLLMNEDFLLFYYSSRKCFSQPDL